MPMLGLLIALASSCLFALCNVIVQQVSGRDTIIVLFTSSVDTSINSISLQVKSVDPFTIAVYRFIGIALPALSIVIYRNEVKAFTVQW